MNPIKTIKLQKTNKELLVIEFSIEKKIGIIVRKLTQVSLLSKLRYKK